MDPLFLPTKQAAAFFGVSAAVFRRIMEKHGLRPIDCGKGARGGLRWRTSELIRVADALHAETQAQGQGQKKRPRTKHSVVGKTADELFRELSAPMQ